MGFLGLVNFALKCVGVLAWPSFALCYPLCASIRAIETNSNHHMRKLVAYWILFSLISLFELAFMQLIKWVPIWPYIKLVVICYLVLPRFAGAYCAYKSYVQPCLSVNLGEVINRLSKPQEAALKTENFLAVAERYVKENGTEALEKLIVSKLNSNEPDCAQKDFKAAELAEKNTAATANWLKQKDVSPVQTEEKAIITTIEVKEMTTTPPAGDRATSPFVKASLENVQKEWTCAVCQLRTKSESNLTSHLQGKKHKAKCEELKAKDKDKAKAKATMQTAENKASPSSKPNKPAQPNQNKTEKHEKYVQVKVNSTEQYKQSVAGNGVNQNQTKKQEEKAQVKGKGKQVEQKENQSGGYGMQNYKNRCVVCDVACTSETDLRSHLSGRKHLSRVQDMTTASCSGTLLGQTYGGQQAMWDLTASDPLYF